MHRRACAAWARCPRGPDPPGPMDGSLSPLQLRAPYGLQRLQWLRDSALHSAMHGAHYQALQGTLAYARVR